MELTKGTLRFGSFEVDLRTEELRKQGRKLQLPRQSVQVLALLLEHPGELVSREELRERLWPPEVVVDFDHGLNAAVNRLREALGDAAGEPRFIETLPRRGYRFIAPLTPPLEQPAVPTNGVGAAAAPAAPELPADEERQTSNAATVPQIPMRRETAQTGVWRMVLLASAVLLIGSGGVWWRLGAHSGQYAIAVLPFKNLSPEPGNDYFSDGLTDEIITNLSTIDSLLVKSRTSSFAFKDKPRNVHDVGSQLGADLLLEGSVSRTGQRLRIAVGLVRVADDSTLWSQQYDRELKDVFAVQDEISRSIVNELRLKHVGGQRRYTTDLEAYDLYLRARSLSDSSNSATLAEAFALYRQILAKAPDFAPAYAGLAQLYEYVRMGPKLQAEFAPDAEEQLRRNAEKALQLDPLLAEAHSALGVAQANDLAWGDAERSFRRALQINPNLALTHQRYGEFVLETEGRMAEAVQQYREAVKLDPLSDWRHGMLAFGLLNSGAYREALEQCRRAMALNPDESVHQWVCARALWFDGHHGEAIALFEQQGESSRQALGYAYASIGRRREAEQIAAEEHPAAVRRQAFVAAGLGQKERVLEAFEKLAAMHDDIVDAYPVFPEFALMRDDPRMTEFRRRRNLPWPPEPQRAEGNR